jgi:hypothetical protein
MKGINSHPRVQSIHNSHTGVVGIFASKTPSLGGAFVSKMPTLVVSSTATTFLLGFQKCTRHLRLRFYCLTSSALFFACCFPLFQYSTAKLNASCATFSSVLMLALTVLMTPSGPCVFLYSSWYVPNR